MVVTKSQGWFFVELINTELEFERNKLRVMAEVAEIRKTRDQARGGSVKDKQEKMREKALKERKMQGGPKDRAYGPGWSSSQRSGSGWAGSSSDNEGYGRGRWGTNEPGADSRDRDWYNPSAWSAKHNAAVSHDKSAEWWASSEELGKQQWRDNPESRTWKTGRSQWATKRNDKKWEGGDQQWRR